MKIVQGSGATLGLICTARFQASMLSLVATSPFLWNIVLPMLQAALALLGENTKAVSNSWCKALELKQVKWQAAAWRAPGPVFPSLCLSYLNCRFKVLLPLESYSQVVVELAQRQSRGEKALGNLQRLRVRVQGAVELSAFQV